MYFTIKGAWIPDGCEGSGEGAGRLTSKTEFNCYLGKWVLVGRNYKQLNSLSQITLHVPSSVLSVGDPKETRHCCLVCLISCRVQSLINVTSVIIGEA
jgi:hypothetical protein